MKVVTRLACLLTLICVLPIAHAADLSGTWNGAFEFNGSSVPVTLHLTIAGATVTGTVEGLPTTPTDIHDGKVDGSTITFWVNTEYQGQTYKLVYNGKISADKIDFAFGTDDGSFTANMTANRTPLVPVAPPAPNITGSWKGAFELNGTSMPVTFNLKSAASVVTGTVEGLGPAPVEIHEGKLDGESVTFWLNADYQGQTYTLVYKGKITAGQIQFDFGTADNSWGASVTAKKS